MENNLNNIKKMYDKLTYFDQYGGSLILFIIVTIVVILLVIYFHVMINIEPIIDDWPNQRCNPAYIPFAGLITRPEGVTAAEYTSENFTYCTQNILKTTTGTALEPLSLITKSLQSVSDIVKDAIQSIRAMFDKIRTSMQAVTEEIMGRTMNIMIPLMQIIISFKDLIGKIQGSMTAGLFTLLGGYYALRSLMGAIVQFIIMILITLSIMIAVFWIAPFSWAAAISNTAIFVAIAVPMAIILAFMIDVLKVKTDLTIPKLKCFDKNTLIKMNDGKYKRISQIQPGELLSNNNTVTGKIKVATEGSRMYLLNNILVSDSHKVKLDDFWIRVSEHPNAVLQKSYNEKFLYCLNTIQKIINVNNTIFTDWDEIYDKSLNELLKTTQIQKNDIHKYLDCGFSKYTKIPLQCNEIHLLNKIKINDILENGEKVYGIVELDGKFVNEQYKYNLGENKFIEGYSQDFKYPKINIKKHNKLYHILTDKGTLTIENITINDYNASIDRFLKTQ